jgi:hypothetical protein
MDVFTAAEQFKRDNPTVAEALIVCDQVLPIYHAALAAMQPARIYQGTGTQAINKKGGK